MALEIEKKFLVIPGAWTPSTRALRIVQGYLCPDGDNTVRVRVIEDKAFITIKGKASGISRLEFEYPIPVDEAQEIIDELCKGNITEKERYLVEYRNCLWEIDVFAGANLGLVIAEIEMESEISAFEIPPWAGQEVSMDIRYSNRALAKHPYSTWLTEPDN